MFRRRFMGSVKEVEIIKKAEIKTEGEGEFIFSDRYSVFDWGEMPDHIEKKGSALCMLSSYFFALLEKNGIKTHFLGLNEGGVLKPFSKTKSPSNRMRVKVVRVLKPSYDKDNNKYDYSVYKKGKLSNYLIPLEVIYRNKLTEGSSVFKRIKEGSADFKSLGLQHEPVINEVLKNPVVDVSTKLEHTDRYLTWDEAQKISGLDDENIKKLKELVLKINKIITTACKKAKIENIDGKFEFGMDAQGDIMVVDVLGTPDECRFLFDGFHISKEFARRWYRKTEWFTEIEKAKKMGGSDWKSLVKVQPPPLPAEIKKLISQMYLSVTNELTGKRVFDSPPLKKVIKELKKYDT
jgi:phosphoribosylaminoimidazole-succinocarboxamide synthase